MANEIYFTGSLTVYKSTVMAERRGRSVVDLSATMTANFVTEGTVSIATTATAIPLGQITAPGWMAVKNTDATNYVRLMNGSGGAQVVKLLAGEWAFFRWDDTATPYAIANTSAVVIDYLLASL